MDGTYEWLCVGSTPVLRCIESPKQVVGQERQGSPSHLQLYMIHTAAGVYDQISQFMVGSKERRLLNDVRGVALWCDCTHAYELQLKERHFAIDYLSKLATNFVLRGFACL